MSDPQTPEQWEIWHARFNFEGSGYKFRPVIVASVEEEILVIMVTGVNNKLALEHDCEIADWKKAGLTKPSIARVDRIATLPLNYIGTAGRIGKLTIFDRNKLTALLNEVYNSNQR